MATTEDVNKKPVYERVGCAGKKRWIVVEVNKNNEFNSKGWWKDLCVDLPHGMYWVRFKLEQPVSKLTLENIINGIRSAKIVVMGLWLPDGCEEEKRHFVAKGMSAVCASEQRMATIERMESKINQKFNATTVREISQGAKSDSSWVTTDLSGSKSNTGLRCSDALLNSKGEGANQQQEAHTESVGLISSVKKKNNNVSFGQNFNSSVQPKGALKKECSADFPEWPEHWRDIFKSHELFNVPYVQECVKNDRVADKIASPILPQSITHQSAARASSLTGAEKVKIWDFLSWKKEGIELPKNLHNHQRLPPFMCQNDERLEGFMKHLIVSERKEKENVKMQLNAFIELDKEHLKAVHVKQRVRSGQTVSSDRDLIVKGSVASGGRVEAVGEIHIYGTMLGTAAAGMSGDKMAEVFVSDFQGESIHIAGLGSSFEENEVPKGKTVRFYRMGEKINHEVL